MANRVMINIRIIFAGGIHMLIAIDHGNYAVKTTNHSFISGLSEHTVKPPMTDEIVEYGGKIGRASCRERVSTLV